MNENRNKAEANLLQLTKLYKKKKLQIIIKDIVFIRLIR